MMLREEDIGDFKTWLLPKLDKISEADAEVLADYVIALVTADEPEASIRRNCLESLADFLQDNTASFVDDILNALRSNSYVTSRPNPQFSSQQAAPIPSIVGTSNAEYEPRASHSTGTPPLHAPKGPAATRTANAQHRLPGRPTGHAPAQSNSPGLSAQPASRKRKQTHRDASETRVGQDAHHSRAGAGSRPMKQTARRGGRTTLRGGAAAFEPQNFAQIPNMPNLANLPPPPPGPLPFDVNNPMAFFALMATLGTGIPGMSPLPPTIPQGNGTNGQTQIGKCHDYHEKGFCRLGMMCSFEHEPASSASANVPGYDPDQPGLGARFAPVANKRQATNRTYSDGVKRGHNRAPFSASGPSHDRTNNTLVVEQIPEDKCSEDAVRDFFSEFGVILDVQMHAYKRLAIIKFEDHATANRAYMSPKAIFENRFVKVYWFRKEPSRGAANGFSEDVEMADDEDNSDEEEEVQDLEAIAERQAEAQKAFEERRRKEAEADAKAADIERQLKEKEAELEDIKKQLAELAGEDDQSSHGQLSQALATLQAEAEDLFAQTDSTDTVDRESGFPPRVDYRGRGRGFAPSFRGRGMPRGGYRGRGAFAGTFGRKGSSVKRLDNRPRRLAVSGIEKGTSKDEALRQYLVNMPECSSIEPHPEQPDTVVLTFQERYQAEIFLDQSRKIPDAGPLELAWVPNDAFGGIKSEAASNVADAVDQSSDDDSSATVTEDQKPGDTEDNRQAADEDMDVADDVDRWL